MLDGGQVAYALLVLLLLLPILLLILHLPLPSMEMMILSILPLALHCEWGINQYRQAFLTTIVFIGKQTFHKFEQTYVVQIWLPGCLFQSRDW